MKIQKKIIGMLMMAGLIGFTACNDDEDDDTPSAMSISSIETTDGTDLFGATNASDVALDQSVIITFSAAVDATSLANVGIFNGSTAVASSVTASGSTVTIDPTDNLFGGTIYTVKVQGVKSTAGATVSTANVNFTTSGIGLGTAPQAEAQITYLQLNGNFADVLGNATLGNASNTWVEDRFGNINGALWLNGASGGPGTGDMVEFSGDFINPSMTISTWFKVNPADFTGSRVMFGLAVERGFFLEVGGNIDWLKYATSHKVSPDPGNHFFGTAWTDPNGSGNVGNAILANYSGSINALVTSEWAHIVMTFDATTSIKSIYVNGTLVRQDDLNWDAASEWNLTDLAIADQADGTGAAIDGIDPKLTLGYFCSVANTATGWANAATAENTFKGAIDDYRIWDVALTQAQVLQLFDAEKVQ
jgi:hypothetical protein